MRGKGFGWLTRLRNASAIFSVGVGIGAGALRMYQLTQVPERIVEAEVIAEQAKQEREKQESRIDDAREHAEAIKEIADDIPTVENLHHSPVRNTTDSIIDSVVEDLNIPDESEAIAEAREALVELQNRLDDEREAADEAIATLKLKVQTQDVAYKALLRYTGELETLIEKQRIEIKALEDVRDAYRRRPWEHPAVQIGGGILTGIAIGRKIWEG